MLVALLVTGRSAGAAEPVVCAERPACLALQEQGVQAHNEKRYAEAVRFYEQARASTPDPRLLVLMGRSRFRLGEIDAALALYNQARPDIADPVERAQLERFIGEANAQRTVAPDPKTQALLPPRGAEGPPVYKRWWFWTILGVAAAGTATALGVGLAARGPDTTGVPEYRWSTP